MESPSRIEGKLFAALSCFRYAGTSLAGGSIAFLLLAVTAPDAVAKCSVRSYTISGLVVDSTGVPARGALVGVSWIQQARPAGPAFSVADEYGRYSIPLRFDTYSGYSLRGDRCDKRTSWDCLISEDA